MAAYKPLDLLRKTSTFGPVCVEFTVRDLVSLEAQIAPGACWVSCFPGNITAAKGLRRRLSLE